MLQERGASRVVLNTADDFGSYSTQAECSLAYYATRLYRKSIIYYIISISQSIYWAYCKQKEINTMYRTGFWQRVERGEVRPATVDTNNFNCRKWASEHLTDAPRISQTITNTRSVNAWMRSNEEMKRFKKQDDHFIYLCSIYGLCGWWGRIFYHLAFEFITNCWICARLGNFVHIITIKSENYTFQYTNLTAVFYVRCTPSVFRPILLFRVYFVRMCVTYVWLTCVCMCVCCVCERERANESFCFVRVTCIS